MTEERDSYRILVAGDELIGYGLCLKLDNPGLIDPYGNAKRSLETEWPDDVWTKYFSLSKDGKISTLSIEVELHGAWVWELYNVVEPRDYFRRYDGFLMTFDPTRPDALDQLTSFIDSVLAHFEKKPPMVLVGDQLGKKWAFKRDFFSDLADYLNAPYFVTNLRKGKMVEEAFRTLAVLAYEAEMGLPEKPVPGKREGENPRKDPI
ncbi:MAG: hypothetical protein ACXADL_03380 [Candidatus Thorarchaeota archaeon]